MKKAERWALIVTLIFLLLTLGRHLARTRLPHGGAADVQIETMTTP